MPGFLGANNYPITIVVRFSSSQLRHRSIQKANEFTTKIIDADDTPNVMKAIFESLRENRIVITQCDEIDEWRPSRDEIISFLGKKTHLDRTTNILSKRGSAAIVFGVMHRDQKLHYKFTATSPEEMEKHFHHSGNGSVGAAALKYLEQFIYKHPQEWYQWKKYSQIETLASNDYEVEHVSPVSLLDPSFGKAS
jgi:lauroyl/myristoyl acyltransferase